MFVLSVLITSEGFAQTLAFPGAEGFGKYTSGGRGGDVYQVTNLNDSGPGSLRFGAEMEGARTIVFNISGTIQLETDLRIRNDSISIFGQTAPGDGIAVSGRST
ncbi:MAG TPA: pectate lyase, partial [Balneolaceae bacterium]|nr:pectate lyase [Balneolaceae bacterium]